jgi:DNA-binding SARP family transcriptional activator
VGYYWEKMGQWEKAINCYQKGLEIDDLAEEFYQHLMICHRHLGLRSEALAVYHHCCKILSATLGIEPSPETKVIYRSLLSE